MGAWRHRALPRRVAIWREINIGKPLQSTGRAKRSHDWTGNSWQCRINRVHLSLNKLGVHQSQGSVLISETAFNRVIWPVFVRCSRLVLGDRLRCQGCGSSVRALERVAGLLTRQSIGLEKFNGFLWREGERCLVDYF